MKTMRRVFLFAFALAFLAGCQDELAPLQDANNLKKQLKVEEVDDPVVESVTGSGHATRTYGIEEDVWRTFSLTSRLYESGLLEGSLQLNNHAEEGSSLEAEILCMEFYGDQVLFVCQAVSSDPPELTGNYYAFWVRDNGQGKKTDPDEICFLYQVTENTMLELCAGTPEYVEVYLNDTEVFQVESGNIMVHKSKD